MKVIIDWKKLADVIPELNRKILLDINVPECKGTYEFGVYIGTFDYTIGHTFRTATLNPKTLHKYATETITITQSKLDICKWDYYAEEWNSPLYSNLNDLFYSK